MRPGGLADLGSTPGRPDMSVSVRFFVRSAFTFVLYVLMHHRVLTPDARYYRCSAKPRQITSSVTCRTTNMICCSSLSLLVGLCSLALALPCRPKHTSLKSCAIGRIVTALLSLGFWIRRSPSPE